ncbi:LysR family transcriptional regulator [uncultured Azohydromonas sp.]|uniref:LysR family transcriptional regulator n=1 Tax=uncultured Azohydromonas sp. TaxID=487342 RepID=UPI002631FFF9|nr:LysR family transcriptional regulator [uncultured Azohydromonas sp.]
MLNQLELLRVFQVAAECTSFREAALRLGASPQTVTRAVKELEDHFGELLFHRSTRQVRITAFGEELLARSRPLLAEMQALFSTPAQAPETQLSGRVRITGPRILGRGCLVPALTRLAAAHPAITLDLRLSDVFADVVDERIDVGVRIGFLRDSRLVARKAGEVAFSLVATPELVARLGAPRRVEDLVSLPVTALLDPNTGRIWSWYFAEGRQFTPEARTFVTDDPDAELGAILAGLAFGQVPDYLAAPLVREGRLVELMRDQAPTPWDIYVYRPQRGPVPARVRLVFDHIVSAVAEHQRALHGH